MQRKTNERISKQKKEKSAALKRINSKDINIIETTYEKVLSIINKVKDFLRKNTKNSQKLVDDLEWVIKVISNKSLYSYEFKKPKLTSQNAELNKFINFVTKYNEEVLEMNKKHVLVSGLLNLVKKGEILNKPSLCLKRILPEELKNMDYKKEKEKKIRKHNFINLIGNAILNLYYKTIEKRKQEGIGENEIVKIDNGNKDLSTTENNDKTNLEIIENKKNNKSLENSKDKQDKNKSIFMHKYTTSDYNLRKINKIKKNNQKKSTDERHKKFFDFKSKFQNYYHSTTKRKNNNTSKLTKNEKQNINNIKNTKGNNYLKNPFIDIQGSSYIYQNEINHLHNNYKKIVKNKINNNSTYFEKGAHGVRNLKYDISPNKYKIYKNGNSSKDKTFNMKKQDKLYLRKKILKDNNNNNKILDSIESSNKKNKSYSDKTSKSLFNNKYKTLEYKKDNLNEYDSKTTEENDITVKEEKIHLNILIDNYFEDMKMIIDKDFDIFGFKSKVGYKNVLPLMCHCILKTLGLLDNRIISTTKLEPFLVTVTENYKVTTLYHNSLHGADVTQSLCCYFLNSNAEEICETNVLDLLGIIVSAMGHDLGHPGLNNIFHINASTDLAITYNDTSCLENYHTSFLFKILRKNETNIFEKLSVENYKTIRKRMISQILATDMANHGEVLSLIRTKVKAFQEQEEENEGEDKFTLLSGNEKTKFEEQQILLNYLIHLADLGHNCKKFVISKQWIHLLCEEFWIQGDKEKSLGIPVSFLCDRDKIDVPTSQINFLRGFIISSFDCLVTIFPNLRYTTDNARNNMKEWQKLFDEHRVTGWTPRNEINDEKENEKNV